jgi:hypothetical protein
MIEGLKRNRHLVMGSPHKLTLYTDHDNLRFYRHPQKLNRQVACYVMICRTCYHACVHLAILRICDTRALDALGRGTLTAQHGLLFMGLIAFCLYDMRCVYGDRYDTCYVVAYVRVRP